MPLVVYPEAGFDSYVSLADADTYLASLGYAAWALKTEPDREAALRRGTQYIYARRPIATALDPEVHPNIKAATAEAAFLQTQGKLYRDIDPTKGAVIEKTVGPLTFRYDKPPGPLLGGQFPVIDDLLYGLVYTGAGFGPVVLERV